MLSIPKYVYAMRTPGVVLPLSTMVCIIPVYHYRSTGSSTHLKDDTC